VTILNLACADVHTYIQPSERGRWNTRIFQGLPRQLKQQTLLRIHLDRFARRDTKDGWIKIPDSGENSCGPGIAPSALMAMGMAKATKREPILWYLRNTVAPVPQQGPQFVNRIRAWKATRPSYDR